ncbi:MAG: hemerythrin domain-containing protein [Acidimicrobiia bacterium]
MNKATELIQSEHRQVEALFSRFEETGDRDVAMEICDLLERHTEMEEQILYPELKSVDEDLYEDAKEEHEEADELIQKIRQAEGDELRDLVLELKGDIQHHVEDEETEDLPAMEESCGTERMDQLGQEMEQWRSSRGGGGDGAVAGRDATDVEGAAGKEELLDLTKDELYEKAKEADISGRSDMNKDELAEELSKR